MTKILFYSIISLLILSCNAIKPKKVDTRETPINAQERAKKNIKEGKGSTLRDIVGGGRGATTYEFSTSNPMWRASLEILDFLPFSTVDYSGGMIITDWYSENNSNDAIKITVRFLANEVRSDSLKISVHKKECKSNMNCRTNLLKNSAIGNELRTSIIRKAAILERESKDKKKK